MSAPGIDPRVLDALQNASSLELFQLSTLIERLLADPRRIIAVRKDMHLGQTVRFVDWRDGSLREGKVVAMREAQVTLQDLQERNEWKLPYAAIELPQPDPAAHVKRWRLNRQLRSDRRATTSDVARRWPSRTSTCRPWWVCEASRIRHLGTRQAGSASEFGSGPASDISALRRCRWARPSA